MNIFAYAYILLHTLHSVTCLQNLHVLILYSLEGNYANYTDLRFIAPYWQQHVITKVEEYSPMKLWPFNLTLEYFDIKSDCKLIDELLTKRYSDMSLPEITAIIAEGDDCAPGSGSARFAGHHQIPIILTGFNPDLHTQDYIMPPEQNTSFLMEGPTYRTLRQMVDTYIRAGVQTIIAVANERYDLYNPNTCFGTANVMALRGIQVLGMYTIGYNESTNRVIEIVDIIKQKNPDAVLWCDWGACALTNDIIEFLPLQHFKNANYMPKSFNLLDCLDSPNVPDLRLFDFVTGGNYVSEKIKGFQYTEDGSLYSSMFRPSTPSNYNGFNQMELGLTLAYPSSTSIFFNWYNNLRGYYPSYPTAFCWAAFDIMEKAMYLVGMDSQNGGKDGLLIGSISPMDVFHKLQGLGTLTPVGLVQFDVNRINTISPSILLQALPHSSSAEIVGPVIIATSDFVYPMPNWEDRIYTWSLTSTSYKQSAIIIAGACSLLLLVMIITVYIHRKDLEIKMLHYFHIIVICACSMCVCWSSALLWQSDNIQIQCNGYLWGIYLPVSFLIILVNMKAYRLSKFLYYTAKGLRPRPFTHLRVVRLTSRFYLITLTILMICAVTDKHTLIRIVVDKYRPKLDYYVCPQNNSTVILLYLLAFLHFFQTIYCVSEVRNGMEAFQDGMIIKESFIVFYSFIMICLILSSLGIEPNTMYVLRTLFLSSACTFFCLRLLINRCAKYWFSDICLQYIGRLSKIIRDTTTNTVVIDSNAMSSLIEDGQGELLYHIKTATDDDVMCMIDVIMDTERGKLFKDVADSQHVLENVHFIEDVLKFQSEETLAFLIDSTKYANILMYERASEILYKYIEAGSEEEVNVSAHSRTLVENSIKNLITFRQPYSIPIQYAKKLIVDDPYINQRANIFEPAFKEIVKMLFQNLWTKFKVAETEKIAGEEEIEYL